MAILSGIKERHPSSSSSSSQPTGTAGGFPKLPTVPSTWKKPSPPQSSADDGDNTTENARRVAGMTEDEISEALSEVRALVSEKNLEWLRTRSHPPPPPKTRKAPLTQRELDAMCEEELPEFEKAKLREWEEDEVDVLVRATSKESTNSAKRYAISKLKDADEKEKAGNGLRAGLFFCLDDTDVERARSVDKYAVENLRDALKGLREVKDCAGIMNEEDYQFLTSIAVSEAECVNEFMRSQAIAIAMQGYADCCDTFLDTPKAKMLLESRRSDFEELCLRAWTKAPHSSFFDTLSSRFTAAAAAKQGPHLVEVVAARFLQDENEVPVDEVARALVHPSRSDSVGEARRRVLERCSRSVALRLWIALERDFEEEDKCPPALLEDPFDDNDLEAAEAALELVAESGRSPSRALTEAIDRAEDKYVAPRLHELAASVYKDDSRLLFALAASKRDPKIAAKAAEYATRQGFVEKTCLDGKQDRELPPPRAWLLAPIVSSGNEACLAALERGNRYTDKLPDGVKFAHVAHAALFDIESPLFDELAPRSKAADVAAAIATASERDDAVSSFASAIADRFLQTGNRPAGTVAAHLVRPNMPLQARKAIWRQFAGCIRLLPIPDDECEDYVRVDERECPADELALALANDPYEDANESPAHKVAIAQLAAGMLASSDFERRTKIDFLRKHSRNPEAVLADLSRKLVIKES